MVEKFSGKTTFVRELATMATQQVHSKLSSRKLYKQTYKKQTYKIATQKLFWISDKDKVADNIHQIPFW